MRLILPILFIAGLLCTQASCNSQEEVQQGEISYEALIESRRQHLVAERAFIDGFIADKGWPVETTGTGLRYHVYHNSRGQMAQNGMQATLEYSLSLLNDSVVYSSKENGLLDFTIGQDYVESGLHEAMLLLAVGDSAHLVLPSHLAHGLTGDFGRIPGGVPVYYDLFVKGLR